MTESPPGAPTSSSSKAIAGEVNASPEGTRQTEQTNLPATPVEPRAEQTEQTTALNVDRIDNETILKQPTIRIRHASVRELVDKKKDITLSFENLTVHVPATGWQGKHCCRSTTSTSPIKQFAQEYLGMTTELGDPFYALQDISGYVRTGEMILVVGAGQQENATSVLIRALTGRLTSHDTDLSGNILLNGQNLSRHHWQRWRRVAPHVSATDTTHSAVLTVRETFEFAAQCCRRRDKGDLRWAEKVQDTVNELLRVLDLEHVADTVVGDENLRGISGGQKRRVTVGEGLLNPQTLLLGLENITDGLSSEDSFNLISRLSRICKLFRVAAVVSLLQASDEIVHCFDKIMVLSASGGLSYFGPVSRDILKSVFIDKNTDSSLDLGSICDLVLNPAVDDAEAQEQVRKRFLETPAYAELVRSLTEIRLAAGPQREHDLISAILPQTKYELPWQLQFRVLASRRLKLISRNAATYTRIVIAIVFGCIVGSLFSQLEYDVFGCLSRTGYMFLHCFLVLMLSAAITIPETFRERVTLFKHRSAGLYSGRVSYVTQVILDLPLAILEAVLLSCISYFWVQMNPGANHFFYFLSVLTGLEFVGQALGRLLCAISRKQVYANTLSSVIILVFGTVAGFMPGYSSIPAIFRWLSWVTPASYAFEGLMINEFDGRNFTGLVVTTSEGTTDLGSFSGSAWLAATGIPRKYWTSLSGIKTFDVIFLFFLAFVFDILGCYCLERKRDVYFNQSRRPQRAAVSTVFSSETHSNDKVVDEEDVKGSQPSVILNKAAADWPNSLTITDLSYYVPLERKNAPLRCTFQSLLSPLLVRCFGKHFGGDDEKPKINELRLLNSVAARFCRGRMVALMGPSGCGKSTLLDVIAGYKSGGRIAGEIMVDGRLKDPIIWKSISAYAEQNDILNPYLSTIETLRFTAACRLSGSVNREAVIEEVVELMELDAYTNMVIGREIEGEGLPKHARKRLTIAIQLVTMPRILFADEPTTGLSTTAANVVMKALRRCTDKLNLITVATIHQPSKLIWDAFDDLLLMVKGGNLVYMGEMGEGSHKVLDHFSKLLSQQYPHPHENPADFVLSAVSKVSEVQAISSFQESDVFNNLLRDIEDDKRREESGQESNEVVLQVRRESGHRNVVKEYILLAKRHYMTQWRNPSYSLLRLLMSTLSSLYVGILFMGDKSTIQGGVYSIGAIFFLVFILVIPMQSSVVPLVDDRAVLYRESTSGLYSRFFYGLGQQAADIPFHILNTLLMFVCFYFVVGFQLEGDLIGYFILMVFFANWVVMSLGQFFALASPNEESATGLAGLSVILSVILMGFLITVTAMPDGWTWAYWANIFRYLVQGLVTNELAGTEYTIMLPAGELLPQVSNATYGLVFPPGVNVSTPSAVARQVANFFALAIQAAPGTRYDWNTSGIVAVGSLLRCMVENDCLVEPLMSNFISCNIVNIFPTRRPPCQDEFRNAVAVVDVTEMASCLDPLRLDNTTTNSEDPLLSNLDPTRADELNSSEELQVVLCILRLLLPAGALDDLIRFLSQLSEKFLNVAMIVIDVFENGISIPAELILLVFGWADFQNGELVAPYKWWYCMFATAMFIVGLVLFQMLAICFVVWTKR